MRARQNEHGSGDGVLSMPKLAVVTGIYEKCSSWRASDWLW